MILSIDIFYFKTVIIGGPITLITFYISNLQTKIYPKVFVVDVLKESTHLIVTYFSIHELQLGSTKVVQDYKWMEM